MEQFTNKIMADLPAAVATLFKILAVIGIVSAIFYMIALRFSG
jgi:hypothetical protein